METYDYFQRQKAMQQAADQKRKELELQQRQEAEKRFMDVMKPLNEYRVNTGYTDPTPDGVVTDGVRSLQEEAVKMYKSGKSPAEVSMFIQSGLKNVDAQQNWFKNAKSALDEQISTIGKDSGIDPNRLRELGLLELITVPDGKGGRRRRMPGEMDDVSGIVTKIMDEHPDKITVDLQRAYDIKADSDFSSDYKTLRLADGRVTSGKASVRYNPTYQDVKQMNDKSVQIVTKSAPATINGEEITGPDGKPIMVLPQDAYMEFVSNPGRRMHLSQEFSKLKQEQEDAVAADAKRRASEEINMMYGMKLKDMPASRRLRMVNDLQQKYIETADRLPDEVLRQKAAFNLADRHIQKRSVKTDGDAAIRITNNYGKQTAAKDPVDYVDVYKRINDAIDNGFDVGNGIKGIGLADANLPTETMTHFMNQAKTLLPGKQFTYADLNLVRVNNKLYIYNSDNNLRMPIDEYFTNARFNTTQKARDEIRKDVNKERDQKASPKNDPLGIL